MKKNLSKFVSVISSLALVVFIGYGLALSTAHATPPEGQGTITVIKTVINNNGGDTDVNSWMLAVTPEEGDSVPVTTDEPNFFPPDTYTVSEDEGPAGYRQTGISCFNGSESTEGTFTLLEGEEYICTITNDDIAPSLTLIKEVTNDNGGRAVAADWTLYATLNNEATVLSGAGRVESTSDFQAGTYTLSESIGPEGYSAGGWNCTDIENDGDEIRLELGQSATCTIINDDQPATLTIIKNTDGESGDGDFNFSVTGTDDTEFRESLSLETGEGLATSEPINLNAGSYDVLENSSEGWHLADVTCVYGNGSIGNSLPQGGEHITVGNGDAVTCTFTNTRQGTLIIKKIVINDNDGTKTAGDFSYAVGDDLLQSFTQVRDNSLRGHNFRIVIPDTPYSVREFESRDTEGQMREVTGYTVSYDNCDNLSIPATEEETCTITNDDIAPPPPPPPPAPSGGGNGPVVNSGLGSPQTSSTGSVLGASTGPGGETTGGSFGGGNNPLTAPTIPSSDMGSYGSGGGVALGASKFIFLKNLWWGMRMTDVTELQKRFTAEGVYTGPITGYFGRLTFAATKTYQKAHGIINTGFVGPLTRAELNK